MARFEDREKAIVLRKEGKSYSQIRTLLKVGKGTLSAWLRDYPLSDEKLRELRDFSQVRIEKYRKTRQKTKEERLDKYLASEKKVIFPFNERDLYLAGLFLYWGEGSKSRLVELALSNTNPAIISFYIRWLTKSLKVPYKKLRATLHLYQDMNVNKEVEYWSKIIKLPRNQFTKPYIKMQSIRGLNYKGGFGHGTCNLRVFDSRLSEKIHMALKAIDENTKDKGM